MVSIVRRNRDGRRERGVNVRDVVDWMRDRPVTVLAGAIAIAVAFVVAPPLMGDVPEASALVAEVNRAYASVPGYASTIQLAEGVESKRSTLLREGRLAGFTEEVVSLVGIATPDGIWLRGKSMACWRSAGGPEATAHFRFGESMISTSNVTYEGPTRVSGGWKLVVLGAVNSVRTRSEYTVDRDSKRVRAIDYRTIGAPGTDVETHETLRDLSEAPQVAQPTQLC